MPKLPTNGIMTFYKIRARNGNNGLKGIIMFTEAHSMQKKQLKGTTKKVLKMQIISNIAGKKLIEMGYRLVR